MGFTEGFYDSNSCIFSMLYVQWKRMEILESLILSKTKVDLESLRILNLDWIVKRTEGFVAGDLHVMVDRAIHFAALRLTTYNQVGITSL